MDRRSTIALLLALHAGAAAAHDTWFERAGGTLRLGTGNLFPRQENAIDPGYLVRSGCRSDGGETLALKALQAADPALELQVPPAAASCWAQLAAFEVELTPDKIALYLREVRPPQPVLSAWAAMQQRGLPWKERYTKHARVALGTPAAAAAADSGMAMDARIESTQPHTFRVLRDGEPLPHFNVEFRSERSPIGIWRQTDAEGRVVFQPPLPGAWLLRGIDLRPAGDAWESRFIDLTFEVPSRTARP
jgi:hypothetical protein